MKKIVIVLLALSAFTALQADILKTEKYKVSYKQYEKNKALLEKRKNNLDNIGFEKAVKIINKGK